jgi:hypothetical protein
MNERDIIAVLAAIRACEESKEPLVKLLGRNLHQSFLGWTEDHFSGSPDCPACGGTGWDCENEPCDCQDLDWRPPA